MLISKRCGVPIRISHSHTTAHEMRVSGKRKLYEAVMRQMINKYSTHRWACGVSAGNWMFGKKEFQVIHNGIDIHQFSFSEEKRELIRRQFNLSKDCLVIGHCGKLSKLKKQEFLIRLMPRILKKRKACLLLIGGGDIEYGEYLKKLAVDCGVNEHVNFTGAVTNVQDYLSAFDVFAFPSLREGTPLALIEAQVNGLPCVINDTIPDDAIITDLVKKISIRKAEEWIRFICSEKRDISKHYDDILKSQGYDIRDTNSIIYQTYSNNE